MTYTVISVIGMDVYVVMDRIVSQLRLQCCRMGITIYQGLMKLFPLTWQHHHLMIFSTTVPIIHWYMRLIPGVDQYWKANPKLDASLLQCTLRRLPWCNWWRDFPNPLVRIDPPMISLHAHNRWRTTCLVFCVPP
jgi:hypothetical protein